MGQEKAAQSISRHVAKLWPMPDGRAGLIESAEAVRVMVNSPGFKAVQAVLEREVASIDRKLDGTGTFEQAEYAREHGRRSALSAMVEAAQVIIAGADEAVRRFNEQAAGESVAGEG